MFNSLHISHFFYSQLAHYNTKVIECLRTLHPQISNSLHSDKRQAHND